MIMITLSDIITATVLVIFLIVCFFIAIGNRVSKKGKAKEIDIPAQNCSECKHFNDGDGSMWCEYCDPVFENRFERREDERVKGKT